MLDGVPPSHYACSSATPISGAGSTSLGPSNRLRVASLYGLQRSRVPTGTDQVARFEVESALVRCRLIFVSLGSGTESARHGTEFDALSRRDIRADEAAG
jgi:hypothetical protein